MSGADAAHFLQICVNLQNYWNMSIDGGLIIEYMDLSHIHLAVLTFSTIYAGVVGQKIYKNVLT